MKGKEEGKGEGEREGEDKGITIISFTHPLTQSSGILQKDYILEKTTIVVISEN